MFCTSIINHHNISRRAKSRDANSSVGSDQICDTYKFCYGNLVSTVRSFRGSANIEPIDLEEPNTESGQDEDEEEDSGDSEDDEFGDESSPNTD